MNTLLSPTTGPDSGLPPGGIGAPHAIRFTRGLPGFEACRSFVLMTADDGPLQCLKAIEGPAASFLVIDPRLVDAGYQCELTEADRHLLGAAGDDTAFLWLALVTVEEDGTMSVNLRAPLVINPARMMGHQVIPHQSAYPLRHVLLEGD